MYRAALLSILLALPVVSLQAQTGQDSAAIRGLIARHGTALRTHNAASVRGDYAATAEWRDASGRVLVGPDSILAYTSRLYADPTFATPTLTRDGPDRWYFIRPDAVYVQYYHRRAIGTVPAIEDIMTLLLVARAHDQWIIQRETNREMRPPDLGAGLSASAARVYVTDEVDEPVQQRGCTPPVVPPGVSTGGVARYVSLRYVVGTNGALDVASIKVDNRNDTVLEQIAIDVILSCDFSPATIKGAPVRQLVDQAIRFIRP